MENRNQDQSGMSNNQDQQGRSMGNQENTHGSQQPPKNITGASINNEGDSEDQMGMGDNTRGGSASIPEE